jgi:hypothetical protein
MTDHTEGFTQMRVGMPRLRTTDFYIKKRRQRKRMERQSKFRIILRMAHENKSGYIPIYLEMIFKNHNHDNIR